MLAVLALAAALGAAAPLPEAGFDPVIRDVLDLVQRTHVDPARAVALPILRGALSAVRDRRQDVAVVELDGALRVTLGSEELEVRPEPADALADAAGPPLERLLDALAPGGEAADRDSWRATLLQGALQSLDRWSSVATGRRRADQQARREGRLVGIGVRIGRREGTLRVLGVTPGSGAAEAGLRSGDELLEVACRDVSRATVSDALALLRGPAGTRVPVVVRRTAPAAVEAERRALPQPSVTRASRPDGIGVLTIDHFSRETPREAARALAALGGSSRPRGLVVDLRRNSGGSMLGAAGVADLFVDRGILSEALDARDQPVEGLRPRVDATPGGDVATPLAVLVDGRTASSSELLAAALAWNDRAVLAGARTFGKVVVGKPHVFDSCDLTVTITSAYMRAAGRRLPAGGLEPDVPIDPTAPDAIDRVASFLLEHGAPSRQAMLDARPPAGP